MSDTDELTIEVRKYRDDITTVPEALRAAVEILQEEGRWVRAHWFVNMHPDLDPEDPFCNNWAVCAEGAVALVTLGVARYVKDGESPSAWEFMTSCISPESLLPERMRGYWSDEDRELYLGACRQLREAGDRITDIAFGEAWQYNDRHFITRTQVIDWFEKAIEMCENELGAEPTTG